MACRFQGLGELKTLVLGSGYTINEFAKKLGVSRVTVYRWIRGESEPSIYMLRQMATLLNTNVSKILGE